jgi:hypothetical protein
MNDVPRLAVVLETNRILSHAQAIRKQLQREPPDYKYMLTNAAGIQESIGALVEQLQRWERSQ